jgi:hypothetical protein
MGLICRYYVDGARLDHLAFGGVERNNGRRHDGEPVNVGCGTGCGPRVNERMLLFCLASATDWQRTSIPGKIVTTMG